MTRFEAIQRVTAESVDVTDLFDQDEWDNGGGPFCDADINELGLTDVSNESPYYGHAQDGRTLGFYKNKRGDIWVAVDSSGDVDLILVHVDELAEQYGIR